MKGTCWNDNKLWKAHAEMIIDDKKIIINDNKMIIDEKKIIRNYKKKIITTGWWARPILIRNFMQMRKIMIPSCAIMLGLFFSLQCSFVLFFSFHTMFFYVIFLFPYNIILCSFFLPIPCCMDVPIQCSLRSLPVQLCRSCLFPYNFLLWTLNTIMFFYYKKNIMFFYEHGTI